MRRLAEVDRIKVIETLRECLHFERQLALAYEGVLDRLATSEPAVKRIVPRLEQQRDEERIHISWLERQLDRLEARPHAMPPPESPIPTDGTASELFGRLCLLEHESCDRWTILQALAETADDEAARQDLTPMLAQAHEHVDWLLRVVTDLARNRVLGTPVTLPIC